jgi:hypothetical protein
MICKLLTEKVVMGLPLLILWGNTLAECVNMVQNDIPGRIGKESKWYPLPRYYSVPRCLIEIQKTPLPGHPVLTSALQVILVITIRGVSLMFKSVIDKLTFTTDFKLINLFNKANANLTYEHLNTSIDPSKNQWYIHCVAYHTLTSKVKRSSNGQLSHCSWSVGIFDESQWYKMKNSVGWRIAMNP